MLSRRLLALILLGLSLSLTGCGATDSGHATSNPASANPSGSGTSTTTETVTPPVINLLSESTTVPEFTSVTFEVEAHGSNLSYQWQQYVDSAWLNMHNKVSPTLAFTNLTIENEGLYRVAVSNEGGSTVSSPIELNVYQSLTISNQPQDVTLSAGSDASFYIDTSGGDPFSDATYQWYKDGVALVSSGAFDGANEKILFITGAQAPLAGNYYAKVTINDETVWTSKASLNVIVPVSIETHPTSTLIAESSSGSLSVLAHGSNPEFQWQKLVGGKWSPLEHETSSTLDINGISSSIGDYRCVVKNSISSLTSSVASVDVVTAISIISEPYATFGSTHEPEQGTNLTLAVNASGSDLSYDWYRDNTKVGSGKTLQLTNLSDSNSGSYQCRIYDVLNNTVHCKSVQINVMLPAQIEHQPQDLTLNQGKSGNFSVSLSGSGPFSYQWQHNDGSGWADIENQTSSILSINSATADNAGDYRCLMNGAITKDLISATASLTVIEGPNITDQPFETAGETITRKVGESVEFSFTATGSDVEYKWYKNEVEYAQSSVIAINSLKLSDAGVYRCEASNDADKDICNSFELIVQVPPTIKSQPVSVSVFEGGVAELVTDVTGTPTVTVTWLKDGEELPSTGTSLVFDPVTLSNAGSYQCIVTNDAGSVPCETVSIEVKEIVRISKSPSNQVVSLGDNASLSVTASGYPPLKYEWFKDGQPYSSGIDLSQLTLSNADTTDAGNYYVIVSNSDSSATSQTSELTVLGAEETTFDIEITWEKPGERTDGSNLTDNDISGYRVYHSNTPIVSSFVEIANVSGANNTKHELENLSAQNHYFIITTIDRNGLESTYSSMSSVDLTP